MKPPKPIESLIFTIRGRKVILDSDLAGIYGVATFRFNEAFKRNRHRFPDDFAFQLTGHERRNLASQIATAQLQGSTNEEVPPMSSQFAMTSGRKRAAAYRPWAFTEHGALMAANILRSQRAAQMSIYVIRAFIQMREQLATNAAILKRLAEIDRTLLAHDQSLRAIWQKLQPLLLPPADPPKRRIGFKSDDAS